jgi:hypothetical protein
VRFDDPHGSWMQQEHKFWYRDPVEIVRTLFGNPLFKNEMVFTAEKHTDAQGGRIYSEIHWSNWWWDLQVITSNFLQVSLYQS